MTNKKSAFMDNHSTHELIIWRYKAAIDHKKQPAFPDGMLWLLQALPFIIHQL